jgi:hypothetical protein
MQARRRVAALPLTLLAVFAGAGLGLALCDQMHVQAGVLSHDAPGPFGQGWWVPLVFGAAGVAIFLAARAFSTAPRGGLVVKAALFALAYAATALLSEDHPYALAAALWVTGLARLARDPEPARAVPFALALAACGPLVELAVSEAGLFAYDDDFGTVALWLSGLYVHGAPLALALGAAVSPARRRVSPVA